MRVFPAVALCAWLPTTLIAQTASRATSTKPSKSTPAGSPLQQIDLTTVKIGNASDNVRVRNGDYRIAMRNVIPGAAYQIAFTVIQVNGLSPYSPSSVVPTNCALDELLRNITYAPSEAASLAARAAYRKVATDASAIKRVSNWSSQHLVDTPAASPLLGFELLGAMPAQMIWRRSKRLRRKRGRVRAE